MIPSLIGPVNWRAVGEQIVKSAGDAEAVYALTGRLYASQSGWILLSVPNNVVRGLFDAMQEPGISLPPGSNGGPFNAHISVMRSEEVEQIGGADKITERGHFFSYQLGQLKSVTPLGWDDVSKVWFVEVKSPELQALRKSYGLPALPNRNGTELQFHITVAVRKKNVLRPNETSKVASILGPVTRRAFSEEPIRYDMQQGVLQNMFSHLGKVESRGQRIVGQQNTLNKMQADLDPKVRMQQFMNSLNKGPEPLTTDKFFEGMTSSPFAKMANTLADLIRAKQLSDRKQYDQKTAILRGLMQRYPGEFFIDDPSGKYYGITHEPTKFRLHMPATAIPQNIPKAQ